MDYNKNRSVIRRLLMFACTGLFLFTMVGCWSSGGDDDGDSSKTWQLSMRYRYYYYPDTHDNEGQLEREEDDNNADGIVDEYWVYLYEDVPNDPGKKRVYEYNHYTGEYPGGVRVATGTYTYNDMNGGVLNELRHVPAVGNVIIRWEYTYSGGLRDGYSHYVGGNLNETGTYIYNAGNHVVELRTTKGVWYYTLRNDGLKLSYDFHHNNVKVREGDYIYDDRDKLIRMDHFELK